MLRELTVSFALYSYLAILVHHNQVLKDPTKSTGFSVYELLVSFLPGFILAPNEDFPI